MRPKLVAVRLLNNGHIRLAALQQAFESLASNSRFWPNASYFPLLGCDLQMARTIPRPESPDHSRRTRVSDALTLQRVLSARA
jgi:hypothetical protein